MLATHKNVIFPRCNKPGARVIIKVLGHQYRWLAGARGYDL